MPTLLSKPTLNLRQHRPLTLHLTMPLQPTTLQPVPPPRFRLPGPHLHLRVSSNRGIKFLTILIKIGFCSFKIYSLGYWLSLRALMKLVFLSYLIL